MSDHRCTPKGVIDVVRSFREIGCDPCWNPSAVYRPRIVYDGDELGDGRTLPWCRTHGECNWVNFPWSNPLPWARKAIQEHQQGAEVLQWGPCYPETAWSRLLYSEASAVCFWGKRVHHPLPGETKKAGSMWPTQLVYLGDDVDRFTWHFSQHGTVMHPRRAA